MIQLQDEPLLPRHPRWEEFIDRLAGPEGCGFTPERWTCHGDLSGATAILARMGLTAYAIRVSVAYFKDHGGYCDCEVVFNVGSAERG